MVVYKQGVPDFNRLRVIATGTTSVTRLAGNDSGSSLVPVNVDGDPVFVCYLFNPAASPAFVFPLPVIVYNITTGVITKSRQAFYDPSIGYVKCLVEASAADPLYGTAETWSFRYYFFAQRSN